MAEPRDPRLRRLLLERPDTFHRIRRAVASLLGTGVAALAALGALLIWHFVRRGRLIREGLGAPRDVRLPEIEIRTATEIQAEAEAEPRKPETP